MDNPEENKIINEAVISTAPQIQASVGAVVALPKEAKKAFFAPMDRKKYQKIWRTRTESQAGIRPKAHQH